MVSRHNRRPRAALLVVAVLAALVAAVVPAGAAPWAGNRNNFASPRFEQVWRNADLAVQQGRTGRSWTWGPRPWFDYRELYLQSPNGLRQVQYFDKARMEINDPAVQAGPLAGVTNGLLVVELVSGRIKLGDGIGPDQNRQWTTAEIPVAGDLTMQNEAPNPVTPSYRSFRQLATVDNDDSDARDVGRRVGTTLVRKEPYGLGEVTLGFRQDLAAMPGADIVAYEEATGHNIPRIFHDFIHAGPVPAIAAFGYPITDPYWITARVAGQDQDLLVQLFERRTLTYTPANPAAFRVEMGNVGQHYFAWRYDLLGKPWATADPQRPIVYATGSSGREWEAQAIDTAGNPVRSVPLPPGALPSAIFPTWDSYFFVYGEARCTDGKRQIIMGLPPKPTYLTTCDQNAYDPAISPDGNQLAFVSEHDGNPELYLQGNGLLNSGPIRLTETAGCGARHPSWLPDGSGLVYESNCQGGNWELYRARLSYTLRGNAELMVAKLISPVPGQAERLTTTTADELWPRVSPDGSWIAFFSNEDGNIDIFILSVDGGGRTRLASSPAADEAPAWSPDSSRIVFNSNRDGDHELFLVSRDGSGLTQLTTNAVDDGYAVWGP